MRLRYFLEASLLLVAGLTVWLIYSLVLYDRMLAQEERDFKQLKADMLAFQADFNKIDPGWEYSEGCHRNGEVFKRNVASSCYLDLHLSGGHGRDSSPYKMLLGKSNDFSVIKSSTYTLQEVYIEETKLSSHVSKDIHCGLIKKQVKMVIITGCYWVAP